MRIPLLRGRLFDERDREGAPRVALISESMARRRLPGRDAIGQRLRIGPPDGPLYTVVGVVGDVKQMSLVLNESEAVYTTEAQWRFADAAMSLVVRTEARRGFALILLQAFALTALILAAAGIYGVFAGSVAERTCEIGVRSALGASRGSILGLVLREGILLIGCGIALGLAGALAASQALATLLFGISRLDPLTYMAVIALMVGVSVLACWTPAWRAVHVDPATTLRANSRFASGNTFFEPRQQSSTYRCVGPQFLVQAACLSASTRLSHLPIWFQLAKVRVTTFPNGDKRLFVSKGLNGRASAARRASK